MGMTAFFTGAQTTDRKDRREALLKEYGEIGANFRMLTDIRFRLLGLLPIATAAAAAFKPEGTAAGRIPFALFGLAVTLGLITYNKRNDQLYNELVGRAGAIEREVGIPDGAFANRPNSWLAFGPRSSWRVDHGRAIAVIYLATISFWLFMALEGLSAGIVRLPPGEDLYSYLKGLVQAKWHAHLGNIVRFVLLLVAVTLPLAMFSRLRSQEKARDEEVSDHVKIAGKLLFDAEQKLLRIADKPPAIAVPTGNLLAELASKDDFLKACAIARKKWGDRDCETKKRVKDRMKENFDNSPSSGAIGECDPARAAHVLSVIVGLPPRYVSARLPTSLPGAEVRRSRGVLRRLAAPVAGLAAVWAVRRGIVR